MYTENKNRLWKKIKLLSWKRAVNTNYSKTFLMYNEVRTVYDRQQKKNPINIIPKAKFNKQVFIGSRDE